MLGTILKSKGVLFSAAVLLLAGVAAILVGRGLVVGRSQYEANDKTADRIFAADNALTSMMFEAILAKNPQQLADYDTILKKLDDDIALLKAQSTSQAGKSEIAGLAAANDTLADLESKARAAMDKGQWPEALDFIISNDYRAAKADYLERLNKFLAGTVRAGKEKGDTLESVLRTLYVVAALAALVFIASVFSRLRTVAHPDGTSAPSYAFWSRISYRFPSLIVLFSTGAALAVGAIAIGVANTALIDSAKDNMQVLRNERTRALVTEISSKRDLIQTLSFQPSKIEQFKKFKQAFEGLNAPAREALIKAYVDNNAFPGKDRIALDDGGDASAYTAYHKTVHAGFVRWVQLNRLRDILFVDLNGDVIYSARKGGDFGQNLLHGQLKNELTGDLFRRSLSQVPPWEVVLSDLRRYPPSHNQPSLMMATTIQDTSGIVLGVLIVELETDLLSEVANNVKDLGDTGEVFLVGPDFMARSNTRFMKDAVLERKIESYSTRRSLAGATGAEVTIDYRGHDVISAYGPVGIMGVRWGIVSKIGLAEAQEPLQRMIVLILVGALACVVIFGTFGVTAARAVSRPLERAIRLMGELIGGNRNVDVQFDDKIAEVKAIGAALLAFKDGLTKTDDLLAQIRKNEAQVTDLLDTSPVGAIVTTTDDDVLFINEPGAAILGRPKAAFDGAKFSFGSLAYPEFAWTALAKQARRDGFVKQAELTIRIAEKGDTILNISIRRTSYGNREGFLIWFDDITAQRQADEQLRQLNERFVAFLDNTPDFVFIRDTQNRYQAASQAMARLAGVPSWRDMLGRSVFDIYPKDAAEKTVEAERPLLEGAVSSLDTEETVKLGAGTIQTSVRRVALKGRDGRISGILGISSDITEQKKAEAAIQDALKQADAERGRSRTIIDSSPDPVVIVRNNGLIDYVSRQAVEMFGYAPSELIGQKIEILIPERVRKTHPTHVKHFFNARQARQMGADRELLAVTKDGREIPVEISLSPMQYGDESLVIASIRDITDRKAADVALKQAKEAAESATRAKGDFLASMSHEIRTPMNGITGMADLLAQSELDDDQKHMLRTIRESGNALITIINDILDISKIEAGKLDMEDVSMAVADVLEGVASTLTPNATKKGIRIDTFIDPAIPPALQGDPVRVRQILFNLTGNAVKFSEQKDVALRATRGRTDEAGRIWVRFDVIDHGIGISPENQAKLFQAFSQAESSTTRKYGGTGLGLAICKRLVEMMGGTVGVTSKVGEGSIFTAEIPFQTTETQRSHEKPRDLTGLRVAVVATGGMRQEAITAYLGHWGAEVVVLAGDAAAVDVIKKGDKEGRSFSSVIFDFGLDAEVQDAAVKRFRKALPKRKTPVILLQDYQHRGARIKEADLVTVDANPLVRYRIITAVAVAAGRASPEVQVDADVLAAKPGKAPTVEEAVAAGQLILLAEDNLTNQDVIRRQLAMLGFTCEIANNGVEALKAWRTGRHAILLTDCHMPEMDGYELTGAIRAEEKSSGGKLPIIAVTANALQGEAERCIAAGMDDYVSKPIAMPALRAALSKWMPPPKDAPAAVPAPENAVPVVDDRVLKDMFGDDAVTFKEIMDSFVGPSEAVVGDILAAHAARDAVAIMEAAHKLKSAARNIGAAALADTCASLEAAGKAADWAVIDALSPLSRTQMTAVAGYIAKL